MTQGVQDLIKAIDSGDSQTIDAAFQAEMANRISTRLEDLRVSVAQNMFATEQSEQVEEEVELFAEEIDTDELASIIESLTEEDFEGLDEDNTLELEEKYEGFAKLKGELAHKAGVKNPGALAAAIGRKKYGKEKFQKMAAAGKMHKEEIELDEGHKIVRKDGKLHMVDDREGPIKNTHLAKDAAYVQTNLTKHLRKHAGLATDAQVYFDDADLVHGDKTVVHNAIHPKSKHTVGNLVDALKKHVAGK